MIKLLFRKFKERKKKSFFKPVQSDFSDEYINRLLEIYMC